MRMQFDQFFFQQGVASRSRLDHQRDLDLLYDLPVPAVNRSSGRQYMNAGRQTLIYDAFRATFRPGIFRQSGEYDKRVWHTRTNK